MKKSNRHLTEAKLRTIYNTTEIIYVVVDPHFRIISYNIRAIEFAKRELGISMEHSQYILDFFPEHRRTVLLKNMNEVLKGNVVQYETDYRQADGSSHNYYVRILPLTKGGASIYGVMLEVSEITQLKSMEQELLNLKLQEQKNSTKAIMHA